MSTVKIWRMGPCPISVPSLRGLQRMGVAEGRVGRYLGLSQISYWHFPQAVFVVQPIAGTSRRAGARLFFWPMDGTYLRDEYPAVRSIGSFQWSPSERRVPFSSGAPSSLSSGGASSGVGCMLPMESSPVQSSPVEDHPVTFHLHLLHWRAPRLRKDHSPGLNQLQPPTKPARGTFCPMAPGVDPRYWKGKRLFWDGRGAAKAGLPCRDGLVCSMEP